MAKDLEERFDDALRKGDRQDVLKAMLRYRWLCENRDMTPEEIHEEFDKLLKRVFRTAKKK